MDPLFTVLKEYLEQKPPANGNPDLSSPLEVLFDQYTQFHSIDNDHIRRCFSKIHHLFGHLTPGEFDQVFDTVCELCLAYEHAAFSEGFRVGAYLVLELDRAGNHETTR